ncbi:uncharacterized protein LOC142170609 isoform X2 [Nicotiana tabacum]|uniref:Uncharacterized protein LOC142170609 isoform X2 n=1 Tax=Nicotiana tabacum TaxID=4097 RepID=A0AC58SUE7_TOBAC
MKSVHGRQERKLILLNYVNQPAGPTEAVVLEFGSFLGTLARNTTLCPLDILDWRKMDTKEDIWEYTKKMSKTNIENRKKLKNPHTAGKRSFALVRSKLENDKETSDPLSPKEVFVATRKKKLDDHTCARMKTQLVKLLKWRILKHNKLKMAMSP